MREFISIAKAYELMRVNLVSEALIGITSLIAILVILKKFSEAYKDAFKDGKKPADIKEVFELFYIYISMAAIIILAPPIFSLIEKGFGEVQDEFVDRYSGDLNMSAGKAITTYETNYVKDQYKDAGIMDYVNPGKAISTVADGFFNGAFYMALLYANKYVFYFFAAGRYLYLLMLQVVAPLAVVCFLSKDLKQYAFNFLKHLTICYLMIPFFFLAYAFAGKISEVFIVNLDHYGKMALIITFVLKASLLKKAQTFVRELF